MAKDGQNAEPSFTRRNWQVLALIVGNLLFFSAVLLWKFPIASRNRADFRAELQLAEDLLQLGEIRDARDRMDPLERRLWRDPESAGLLYALRGAAALEMAELTDADDASDYRNEALAYLQAAHVHEIPADWNLRAREALGQALYLSGRYDRAISVLQDALVKRRQIQSQIFRLSIQAALEQPARDDLQIREQARQWRMLPDRSAADADLSGAAFRLLQANDFVGLRRQLEQAAATPETLPAGDMRTVEERTVEELASDSPDKALEFLNEKRRENLAALDRTLLTLQNACLETTPKDSASALTYGQQRMELGIASQSSNDALIRQARIHLDEGRPDEARELLLQVGERGTQRFFARYLLGMSYFDQARQWDGMSLEEWATQAPAVAAYQRFVNERIAGLRPSDPRQTQAVPWRRRLAEAIGPAAAKRILADVNYRKAVSVFEQLEEDQRFSTEPIVERDYAKSMLMSGIAYTQLRDYGPADRIFENVVNFFPGSEFAEAARFLRAESHGKADSGRAIEMFKGAVESASTPYENPVLPLDSLRTLFVERWRDLEQAGRHEEAIQVAELYQSFAAPGDAEELIAESASSQAAAILSEPTDYLDAAKAAAEAEARRYDRLAARRFLEAAYAKEESPGFPDLVWQAALAAFRGQDYEQAIKNFREFIRAHGPGERDFLANQMLAQSLMAKGRWIEAQGALERILEQYPSSPDRFEGRIRLAQCYCELADQIQNGELPEQEPDLAEKYLDSAERLLRLNTDGLGIDLEPTAKEWEQALFELGDLLYRRERFDQAIPKLREAVRRFPEAERSWDARYRLADAHYRSAEEPMRRLEVETTPQGRAALLEEKRVRLERALQEFRTLAALARDRFDQSRSPVLGELLMNASFRIGDVLIAMENWPGAVDAYSTAANRYQDRPECLAAYIAMANAYDRMGRPADAMGTLRQAKWVLDQMGEQSFAGSALTRQQWNERLDALVGNL